MWKGWLEEEMERMGFLIRILLSLLLSLLLLFVQDLLWGFQKFGSNFVLLSLFFLPPQHWWMNVKKDGMEKKGRKEGWEKKKGRNR